MARNRGLKRLAFFIVFLLPVGWYFFLQLFGDNKFSLELISDIPVECKGYTDISILYGSDSMSAAQINHFNRITYQATKKNIPLLLDSIGFMECVKISQGVVLVSSEGIWGSYDLSREGVDRLLTEMDILLMQKSYGEGVSR